MTTTQLAAQQITPARPSDSLRTATPVIAFLGTGRMGGPMAATWHAPVSACARGTAPPATRPPSSRTARPRRPARPKPSRAPRFSSPCWLTGPHRTGIARAGRGAAARPRPDLGADGHRRDGVDAALRQHRHPEQGELLRRPGLGKPGTRPGRGASHPGQRPFLGCRKPSPRCSPRSAGPAPGSAPHGTRAKLVLNNWLADLTETTAETLSFARQLALEPAAIVDLLESTPLGSPYAVQKARSMLAGDFTPAFALKHALKDADLAAQAARASGTELTLTDALLPRWRRAAASGHADDDLAAIYTTP